MQRRDDRGLPIDRTLGNRLLERAGLHDDPEAGDVAQVGLGYECRAEPAPLIHRDDLLGREPVQSLT